MPNGSLEYHFDEPLYRFGHHTAGDLQGVAIISYNSDGAWSVEDICLDAWNTDTRKFDSHHSVPKDSEVYRILHERLTTGDTRKYVQSEVDEAREDDRMSIAASYADHMRAIRAAETV